MLNDRCYSLNMMKKILFICDADPFNAKMGNAQRTSMMLKAFLNNGFHVDIALIWNSNMTPRPQASANTSIVLWNEGYQWKMNNTPIWKKRLFVNTNETSFDLSEKIYCIINENNYDYVFCRYIKNAKLAGILNLKDRILLDIDDLPEQTYKTKKRAKESILKKIFRKYVYYSLKRQTVECIRNCRVAFLPNKKEAEAYKAVYLPNISTIRKEKFEPVLSNHNILFIGYMCWEPNFKGVDTFISKSWEGIISKIPDARLIVAGKGLPDEYKSKWSTFKNIDYLGFVDDIYDFYSKGNVVICPIYSGAGTNIKVIEAMSMGKACVLSSLSTRGYEDILKQGENVLIASDSTLFTKHVVDLLTDESYCNRISGKAYELATQYFSQKTIDNIIGDLLKNNN